MRHSVIAALLAALAPSVGGAVEIDASALFASLDANQDGRVTTAEAGKSHARLFARLLRTSDDGDGVLTADEFAAALTPLRVEKTLVTKQGSRLPGSDALIVLLARMDADGDRRIEAAEVPATLRDTFQRMVDFADADKNGTLDTRELADGGVRLGIIAQTAAARLGINVAAELAALPPARRNSLERMGAFPNPQQMMADPAQAAEMFARFDANGDGFVVPDEAPEGLANVIQRADRNGDGKLSAAEFKAASQRAARRGGGQQRGNRARQPPARAAEEMAEPAGDMMDEQME
jgi:hypothetical protein